MGKWRRKGSLLLILGGCLLLTLGVREYVEPNLDEISRLKAKGVVTEIVGKTVRHVFSDNTDAEMYFVIKKDEKGRIHLIQANTVLMNQKISALTVALQEKYKSMQPEEMKAQPRPFRQEICPCRSRPLPVLKVRCPAHPVCPLR